MTTDSSQVLRVLDRCLDTAASDSDTVPGVAAAAAKAKTDPDMHQAISLLLAAEHGTPSWECAHHVMAAAQDAESGNCACSLAEHCDSAAPALVVLNSCNAASRATSGADRGTALALAGMVLAAILLERSSLGTDRSRRLRNLVAHSDVAAALTLWRDLADHQPEARRRSGSRPPGTS